MGSGSRSLQQANDRTGETQRGQPACATEQEASEAGGHGAGSSHGGQQRRGGPGSLHAQPGGAEASPGPWGGSLLETQGPPAGRPPDAAQPSRDISRNITRGVGARLWVQGPNRRPRKPTSRGGDGSGESLAVTRQRHLVTPGREDGTRGGCPSFWE